MHSITFDLENKRKKLTCVSISIKAVRSTNKFKKKLLIANIKVNIQDLNLTAIFNGILYKRMKFPLQLGGTSYLLTMTFINLSLLGEKN